MKISDIVLSIPHAAIEIPSEIRSLMPHSDQILMSEADLYTDRIYAFEGPRIIQAKYSRIISDVNRAPDEMYLEGRRRAEGVIMLSQSHGQGVFRKDPPLEAMEAWVEKFHAPFHTELDRCMQGAKFLIDCHSHWSVSPPSKKDAGTVRSDIILGNRNYTTCDAEETQFFRHAFEKLGYSVSINDPFIGRYIIGIHCSRLRTPGIQIEIKRSLYMDEESLELHEEAIERLHNEFRNLVHGFCEWDSKRRGEHMTDLSR